MFFSPVCFYDLKMFLKKIEIFFIFFKLIIFLVFLDYLDIKI